MNIKKYILLPDLHYPNHNKQCVKSVLKFVKDFNPDGIVYMGDQMDFKSISYWEESNLRGKEGKRLKRDYKGFQELLNEFEKASGKCEKIFLIGNHGNWLKKSIDKNPQLEGFWEYENNLNLKDYTIVPYNEIYHLGKLSLIHGYYTNKYHSAKTVEALERSVAYGHCFDDKTELLTKRGFLPYNKIRENDECLTMNKESGLLEWNKVNKIYTYDHNGEMYRFKSPLVDLLVDSQHGMAWKNTMKGKMRYGTAQQLADKGGEMLFKISGLLKQPKEYPIEDNLLKLLAWVIAEGSIYYIGNTPYVDIMQSEGDGLEEIKKLLDALNYSYLFKERKGSPLTKKQAYRFRIRVDGSRKITKYIKDKKIVPIWVSKLSNRQIDLFITEYIKGDGTQYKGRLKELKCIYSSNKEWIDTFQYLLFTNNTKTTPYWKYGSLSSRKCCQLNCQKKEFTYLRNRNVSKEQYNGKKWCVNVDNGTLVVRRNGKMTITQNTHNVSSHTKVTIDDEKDYHTAWSIGCLCNLSPEYRKNMPGSWVHGFAAVYLKPNGNFNLYQIMIVNNKFIFNGKEYKPN